LILVEININGNEREMMAAKKKTERGGSSNNNLSGSEFTGLTGVDNESLRMSFFKNETSSKNPFAFIDQIPVFRTRPGVAIVTAIITMVLTLGISSLFGPNQLDTTTLAARISGGVALTEGELKSVVAELGEDVYWAGPVRGAKYTINAQNTGAIYVRYLPGGKDISDNSPRFRVVATYKEKNGYEATLAAGNQPNGVSLARSDENGVIYYNKQSPTNVYVAIKGQPFQIEIFDPEAETALSLASDLNAIQLIK
jgi:hypothetical protein